MSVERTVNDNGCWSEQEYADGKLHGRWTTYYASGKRAWEREYQRGRQEGIERDWDELGNLREEKGYHLGALHGLWRQWDENGVEEVIGDFLFGTEKDFFEKWPPQPHSNQERILPYWKWEPAQFRSQIGEIERNLALPTRRLDRDSSQPFRDEFGASYFSYINLLGPNEEWPSFDGIPLIPILQMDCRAIAPLPYFLEGVAFLTMFARQNPWEFPRDLVIRTYRAGDSVRHVKPPRESIVEPPNLMKIGPVCPSYPDTNDLPVGLRVLLEDEMPESPILKKSDDRFSSRFGGWPAWIQESRVYTYCEFVLQIDRFDAQTLRGGDSAVHYFFFDGKDWVWASESMSPVYTPSGPH